MPPSTGTTAAPGTTATTGQTGQVVGALDRAARLALDAKADLDGLLAGLGQQVALGPGSWSGAGAAAFGAAYADWAEQQRLVTAKLQWFHDRLTATERLNVATDQAQAEAVAAIQRRLG